MDYEKKYNEALEVMRQWIAPCHTKEQLDTLKKSVFRELAERYGISPMFKAKEEK